MTSISEQLSAVRKRQFDAQLDFMRAMTTQVFATAEQVLALNVNTSRASVERTASTVRQLLSISDPRDLFSVGSHTQEQLSSMFAYSQELFNIAADARLNLARSGATLPAPQAEPAPTAPATAPFVAVAPAPAEAAAPAPEPATAPQELLAEADNAVAVAETPEAKPVAKAKPIAKAVGKVTGKRASMPHPSAAPEFIDAAGQVKLPQIKPADLPASAAAALDIRRPSTKSARKK
jgi:hypothetical protein